MISLETSLAGKVYNHEMPLSVMRGLIKISGTMMLIYLVLKMGDLIYRDAFKWVFSGTLEGNMFLLEIVVGVMIPIVICFSQIKFNQKRGSHLWGAYSFWGDPEPDEPSVHGHVFSIRIEFQHRAFCGMW